LALFLGFEPFAGAYLSSATMQSVQTAHPLFDGVVRMIRDYMAILQQDRTRDFVRFGRRMRDPHATSVNTVDVPLQDPSLPPVTSSSPLLFGFVPYGETQPLVYAGAFGRPDLESVGLLLMNWTKASDNNACSCFGGMAGNQSITLSIAPQDYELSPGTYVLKEVTPPGTPPPPTPIPFSWTGPKSFSFSMPSASLRFVYLERQ